MKTKPIIKNFNIHNIVKLKIESTNVIKIETALAQLREFEVLSLGDEDVDIFIYDYVQRPIINDPNVFTNEYCFSGNFLNLTKEKCCLNINETPIKIYSDKFIFPLSLAIEIVLLKKGFSFVHSAAVEYKNSVYLFPALGGVGKTLTVSSFVFNGGKLLGDDMNILKKKEILGYPSDFSVYSYHLDFLNIRDWKIRLKFAKNRVLNSITPKFRRSKISKLITIMLDYFKEPCINMPPRMIFGGQSLLKEAIVSEVYYLIRSDTVSSKILIERIDSGELAEKCTDILLQEWSESMKILYTYSTLTGFSFRMLINKIRDIQVEIFKPLDCYRISIPINLDNNSYQEQLISYFDNKILNSK